MPYRAKRPCSYPGCPALVESGRCEKHRKQQQRQSDKRRGSAYERGYDNWWRNYAKWFLKQPGNQVCKLRLPGCTYIATCVDHKDPPDGADDPRFKDPKNHQSSCIHCNSVKGHKHMKGDG